MSDVSLMPWIILAAAGVLSYTSGSIPFAYLIVKLVIGEDVSQRGSGNVGAMNVRRSTGSWGWFTVAMLADALKGFIPVAAAKLFAIGPASHAGEYLTPWGIVLVEQASFTLTDSNSWAFAILPMVAVGASILGHNYSVWFGLIKRRFGRTGKGLATGGGALLAYDWRYFIAVLAIGLLVIALTRVMMAGQVAATISLPATAVILSSPDWPFALMMGAFVYAAHHARFIGLLKGREPRMYVDDGTGPRG